MNGNIKEAGVVAYSISLSFDLHDHSTMLGLFLKGNTGVALGSSRILRMTFGHTIFGTISSSTQMVPKRVWRLHFLEVPEPTCFQDRFRSAPGHHFG